MRSLQEEQLFDIIIISNNCSSVNHEKENSQVNYKVIGEFSNAELYVENEAPPLLTYSVKYVKKLL